MDTDEVCNVSVPWQQRLEIQKGPDKEKETQPTMRIHTYDMIFHSPVDIIDGISTISNNNCIYSLTFFNQHVNSTYLQSVAGIIVEIIPINFK